MAEPINPKAFQLACANCSLAELCIPVGLTDQEVQKLDSIISKRKTLQRGDYLFHDGQHFEQIYAVRSGSFKASNVNNAGDERICGFYFPGELLGFHAIHKKHYLNNAIALETSSVCAISFDQLFELGTQIPTLQRHLFDIASQKLSIDNLIDLNSAAEERLARFLLSISSRYQRRGLSPAEFRLSMSRQDIAHYLGLATETISRLFSDLQQQNILSIDRRQVQLMDLRKLQLIATGN